MLRRTRAVWFLAAAAFFAEVQAGNDVFAVRQATPTSPAPSITPTPVLSFVNDDQIQPIACKSIEILWFYTGPQGTVNLIASNVGVSQSKSIPTLTTTSLARNAVTTGNHVRAIPTGATLPPDVTVTIARIDPANLSFTWSPVNVPPGWYTLNASIPARSFSSVSQPFYVYSGSDNSCLPGTTSSSGSTGVSAPTGSPTALPAPAGSSPVGSPSSQAKTNIGVIVGATIGAIAVVAFLCLLWLLYQRRKNSSERTNAGVGGGDQHWKGLHSADSRSGLKDNTHSRGYHKNHTDSVGTTVLMHGSEEAVGAEKNSIYSKLDSPTNPFDQGAGLPVLTQQQSRTRSSAVGRSYSASSSTSNGFSIPDHSGSAPARRPSVPDSVLGRRSLDSTTYPPTSPTSPMRNSAQYNGSHHGSTPSQWIVPPLLDSTPSPRPRSHTTNDATKQTNRLSFGKKRKPVPTYSDDNELTATSDATPTLFSPSSLSPSPAPDHVFSSSPTPSGGGHYSTRNRSQPDVSRPELTQKNSFGNGGKPVHYLMPDLPMPQRD